MADATAFGHRIILFCGSLEPGRDGVGDYTRALADELSRRGAGVALVALADRHLTGTIARDDVSLRIPAGTPWGTARDHVGDVVDAHDPTLLSLQYVPWSFGRRGVAPWLGRRLAEVSRSRPWHVMFHELWVDRDGPLRQRVLATLQRQAILRTLRDMRPQVLHVSVTSYQQRLAATGWSAGMLPLFGAIPPGVELASHSERARVRVVFFGTPPPVTERFIYIQGLCDLGRDRPVTAVLVGGADEARRAFAGELSGALDPASVLVEDAGFLDPQALSAVLAGCDVGVVRNEGPLIGKSSAMLALLEHGLPIWAPLWSGEPLDLPFRAGLLHSGLAAAASAERAFPASFLPAVADQFLVDIGAPTA